MAERQGRASGEQSAQRIGHDPEKHVLDADRGCAGFRKRSCSRKPRPEERRMESLQVPRPAWMTEDLVLLEEQARRFLASELVPHIDKWTQDGIMERSAWDKLGQSVLLCAGIPEEYGGAGGSFAHETVI